ncbi:MAG: protein kinase [Acidobacteriota bacterium]|nr:protein kinase [Acidobacteriota bacterium]
MSDGRRQNLPDPYRLVGTVINGKYRLDAVLGIGGMGIVYLAQHIGINRSLAVKVLKPDVAAADPSVAEAFHREAKISGGLSHPNIISVTDADTLPDGTPFMVMELLECPTLEDELRQGKRFSLDRIERLLSQICDALHYAHQAGLVHRDLKPANIALVGAGQAHEQVKILDFGIAKSLGEGVGKVSQAIGTPLYASPEQFIQGGDIDARADLYSLAVILYRLLTGVLPFQGKTIGEIVSLHLTAPPPPLRSHAPHLSESLEAFVLGALAKQPAGRPATALEFLAGFRAARRGVMEASVPLAGGATDLLAGVIEGPTVPPSVPITAQPATPSPGSATSEVTAARISPTQPPALPPTLPASGPPRPPTASTTLTLDSAGRPPSAAASGAPPDSSALFRTGIPVWAAALIAVLAVGLLLFVGIYVVRRTSAGSSSGVSELQGERLETKAGNTGGQPSVPAAFRERFDQVSQDVHQAMMPVGGEGQDKLLRDLINLNPAMIEAHRREIEAAEGQVAQAAEKWRVTTPPASCSAKHRVLLERYQQLRDALHNYGVSVRNLGNAFARTDFDMSQARERFAESERNDVARDRSVLDAAWRSARQAETDMRDCIGY